MSLFPDLGTLPEWFPFPFILGCYSSSFQYKFIPSVTTLLWMPFVNTHTHICFKLKQNEVANTEFLSKS